MILSVRAQALALTLCSSSVAGTRMQFLQFQWQHHTHNIGCVKRN